MVDADGKLLHSWRTLILPYLDQKPLYDSIDLSKPWDDPANATAYNTVVPVYRCPSAICPEKHTPYLANVASDGSFRAAERRKHSDSEVSDDPADALMFIEAGPGAFGPLDVTGRCGRVDGTGPLENGRVRSRQLDACRHARRKHSPRFGRPPSGRPPGDASPSRQRTKSPVTPHRPVSAE